MTRKEHLQWAKDRAIEYLHVGDLQQAFASFLSDVNKHPVLSGGMGPMLDAGMRAIGLKHVLDGNAAELKRWIEGWN